MGNANRKEDDRSHNLDGGRNKRVGDDGSRSSGLSEDGHQMPMPAGVQKIPRPYYEIPLDAEGYPKGYTRIMGNANRKEDARSHNVDGGRNKREGDDGSRSSEDVHQMPMPAGVEKITRPYYEIPLDAEGYPKGYIHTSVPDELDYDPRTRALYEKAIKEGTEEDKTLRVMVIGCFGQGKTSLTRRLTGETSGRPQTTEGIEIDTCKVNADLEWEIKSEGDQESEYFKRLASVAIEKYDGTVKQKEDDLRTKDKNTAYLDTRSTPHELPEVDIKEKENVKVFKSELLKRKYLQRRGDNTCITLNIWDFGGQFVYYATHQIFHSRDAVYLLVFNLAQSLDSEIADDYLTKKYRTKSLRGYLQFWVNSVHSFAGSEDGYEPVIILVGTHKDQVEDGVDVENCFEEIRKLFDGRPCLHHIQPIHFAISCLYSPEDEIQELRNAIVDASKEHLKKYIPAKWIPLEKALKARQGQKIISWSQMEDINSKLEYPIQDIEQIKLFLAYHNAKGSICYFDEESISKYVVLDPQYLIDAFKAIITSEKKFRVRSSVRHYWNTLCETGVLSPKILEEVWSKDKDPNFWDFRFELLDFLKRLRIISEVQTYEKQKSLEHESRELGEYIVPSLVQICIDMDLLVKFLRGKSTSNVILGYLLEHESVLPTVFQKIVSAVIGRWPLTKFEGQYMLFENTVVCEFENHAGIVMLTGNRLELLVVNLCPPDIVNNEASDKFRRFVEFVIIDEISRLKNKGWNKPLQFAMSLRCNHKSHRDRGSKAFEIFERSQRFGKLPCPDRASHSINVENVQLEWFQNDIMVDHFTDRRLSDKEYSILSMSLGKGWQHIGLQLGIDDVTLQQIQMDTHGTNMHIYAMLKKWDVMNGDGATLNVLMKAVYRCSVRVNWDTLRNLIDEF